jgi:hypothetical protein
VMQMELGLGLRANQELALCFRPVRIVWPSPGLLEDHAFSSDERCVV